MKKIVTLLMLLFVVTVTFAQKGKVTSATSYKESGDLKKAYETIESAIDPTNSKAESTINWARSYQVKGQILQEIHRKGISDIVDEPLFKAVEAYKRAIELDTDKKVGKALTIDLTFLQTDLYNYALASYEKKKYDLAVKCFEYYMEMSNSSVLKPANKAEVVDTAIIFNTALAATLAKDYEKSIKYFKKSIENNYKGDLSYFSISDAYKALGDSVSALNTLKEGFEKYPEFESIVIELINHYYLRGQMSEAIKFIDAAIEKDTENLTIYLVKGTSLEKLGREEEALQVYAEVIKKDDKLYTPYYNTGVIHFNRGVNAMNEAAQLPVNATQKQYDDLRDIGLKHLEKALPYLEKSYELDQSQIAILDTLRLIYYRLGMTEKSEEMSKKIQTLKQQN